MPWKCKQCSTENARNQTSCSECAGLAPQIHHFVADKELLDLGEPLRLEWEVENADLVEINEEQVEAEGMWKFSVDNTTNFKLVASNEIADVEAEVIIKLPPPEISYFKASETKVQIGEPIILDWEVKNASQVFIDRGVGEVSGQSFTEAYFDRPGPVTLRALNASGEVSKSLELELPLPVIKSFYAHDPIIHLGEPSVLAWEVLNVSEIFIDQEVGDVSHLSRTEVSPDRTTAYTLTAKNAAGEVSQSLELNLLPPQIIHFGADNELATEGRSVNLLWEVKNAYKLTIDQGVGEVTDKKTVKVRPNQTLTTFIMTAVGHSGETQAAVDVSIFPIPMKENIFIAAPEVSTDIPLEMEKENFDLNLPEPEKALDLVDMELSVPDLSDIEENIKLSNEGNLDMDFYKNMKITKDLMELEKPSLRKELNRIYNALFKKKKLQKHKR